MNISSQSIFISKHQNTSTSHIMSTVNYFYSQREYAKRTVHSKGFASKYMYIHIYIYMYQLENNRENINFVGLVLELG